MPEITEKMHKLLQLFITQPPPPPPVYYEQSKYLESCLAHSSYFPITSTLHEGPYSTLMLSESD